MRRNSAVLALLLLLCVLAAGCARSGGPKLVACPECGGKVEPATLKTLDGKQMCEACADRRQPPPAAADAPGEHTCAACGMVMAEADMAQGAGKWYCRHCLPVPAAPDTTGGS